jgi:glycine oxidase
MLDYIIVGSGLAGIAFAETALNNNKRIVVISDSSQNSSIIAGGLYNPVILKRFSEVWQSSEQLDLLSEFYSKLEEKLTIKLDYKMPLLRKFYSVEEQNNWFTASDKPNLSKFLSTNLITKKYNSIPSPYSFGEVLYSGYVDTKLLVEVYIDFLISKNYYQNESFDYSNLSIENDFVVYKSLKAKRIVFAEGFGMLLNPFFNKLPLDGTKGELLLIKAPNLNLDVIMKSSIFVLPIGNDLYKVGATYNWDDKTNNPTEAAKKELIDNLKELITCDFEIIEHHAGVRPTVKDRRPMLGAHPIHKNLLVLNGLGTRGVMLAPAMAKMLFNHIENKEELNPYVDIKRFKDFASNPYQSEQIN